MKMGQISCPVVENHDAIIDLLFVLFQVQILILKQIIAIFRLAKVVARNEPEASFTPAQEHLLQYQLI